MESNDLISREAAIAAVEDIASRLAGPAAWAGKVACSEIASAIAALPAERRWEEIAKALRVTHAHAEAARLMSVDSHDAYQRIVDVLYILEAQISMAERGDTTKPFRRLAPPADGAEDKAKPEKPSFLFAKVHPYVTWSWWYRGDGDLWCNVTQNSRSRCQYLSEHMEVDRCASDLAALAMYDADMKAP